jgi:thiamine-phosphate pyrophosphorylase
VPPGGPPGGWAPLLDRALGAADVACVALHGAAREEPPAADAVAALVGPVQAAGVALLIAGDAAQAAAAGADGVMLQGVGGYRAARARLGGSAIVGVRAGESRHEAMVAGEAGADFVGLAGETDLVRWWAEIMEPPAVAFAEDSRPETIAGLAAAGADFVVPGPDLLADAVADAEVLADRLAALAAAIRTARR